MIGYFTVSQGEIGPILVHIVDERQYAYSVMEQPDVLYVAIGQTRGQAYHSVGAAIDAALSEDSQTTVWHD
jgi:hypothetical protein